MDTIHGYSDPNIIRIDPATGKEEMFYSVLKEDIPEEFKKYAEEQLHETDYNKRKGIQKLKKFVENEKIFCPDEQLLVIILRWCKYDIKKSQTKLKRYLKLRQSVAENLMKLDKKTIEIILNDNLMCILPYRDKYGRTLITTRAILNLDMYEADECGLCVLATLLYVASLPLTSICGVAYLCEAKTSSWHILYIIINTCRRIIYQVLDCPIRFARIDVVNENFLIRWAIKILSPIVPRKIIKRITFHGSSYEDMIHFYHPDIVPNDLEGNLGPLSNMFYRKKLLEFIEKLKAEYRTI